MRLTLFLFSLLLWSGALAQPFFPIKQGHKWGLINSEGELVQSPLYDAIGEFKQYGYAVMQREGKVGLLGKDGQEVLRPAYEDLKVLDSTLVAVMKGGEWMVVNLQGKIILDQGYDRVKVLRANCLAYQKGGKWGLRNQFGHELAPPLYDEIEALAQGYFRTHRNDRLGLLSATGRAILDNIAAEIRIHNDSLFFFRQGRDWGAVNFYGIEVIPCRYLSYSAVEAGFIRLSTEKGSHVYSSACGRLIDEQAYDDFYGFSLRHLIFKHKRQLGLMSWCGQIILPPNYDEIQPFSPTHFRVSQSGRWGVISAEGEPLIPLRYDYISPLEGPLCIVKKEGQFGLFNIQGEEVVHTDYQRIALEGQQARAYRQDGQAKEELTLFRFDEAGRLQDASQMRQHFQVKIGGQSKPLVPEAESETSTRQLAHFEWFYAPDKDRWGLRRLSDGSVQMEASFSHVQVLPALDLTIVGVPKTTTYSFDRTTFRFEQTYGLVHNELGQMITELDFLDIRWSDFEQGSPLAGCTFSNGRYGLIDRSGRIVRQDMAFLGEFVGGLARFSFTGRLSGHTGPAQHLGKLRSHLRSLAAPSLMLDYTQHDQDFRETAYLVCENCEWGYIDTSGQIAVAPKYSFAEDFVNEVAIVACGQKWGMVDRKGKTLIPCQYDGVQFLENTDNRMVKVYIQEPKYGLIDTLGQLTVSAVYDELGSFSEGRLAVQRNGLWGFVDPNGREVIPCRFREVQNFSQGLAAARLGAGWGFIDKQGHIVVDFQYKRAGCFNDGLAWVHVDNNVGYINESGEFAIPPHFSKGYDFQWGLARVAAHQKYGLINVQGEYVQRPRFTDIGAFDANGLAIVQYGNNSTNYGLINRNGEMVTRHHFREIGPFHEGLAVVKHRNGFGFINTAGELVIPDQYSKAGPFSEGLAAVQLNGQCGYINPLGELVIPCEYSRCLEFQGGRAVVYKGLRKAGLVDKDGRLVIEPSVDRLLNFQEGRGLVRDEQYRFYYITEQASPYEGYYERATEFKHGVAVVKVNGKWGIINQKGIAIIPPRYDKIEAFEDGYAKVRIQGFSGLASLAGELIVQPGYEYISYAGGGLFRVEKGDKVGYFDQAGQWVWDLER